MRKTFLVTLFITVNCAIIFAQTAEDALRYSRVFYSGTARFTGMSGAFGAVGADFSVLATNPAGIGLYRGSETTFTFAPIVGNTSSKYYGTTATESRVGFGMGNFGVVISIPTYKTGKTGPLKNFNFGIGLNRQSDFNNEIHINGINPKNSMMQSYANILNNAGTPEEYVMDEYPFDIGLAYATNLVFHDSATNSYYCDAAYGGVIQDKQITTYGAINEFDIAFGANFSEKFFVGLTFGIPTINYHESSVYQEARTSDTIPNFISLAYYYDLHTRGTGFNLKAGIIYKPADWIRFGASIHTPTWYPSMSDNWSSSMQSRFTTSSWDAIQYSPAGYYDYKLTTPFRAFGSLALLIGQYGLFSADYEYADYAQASFNSKYDSYSDVNNTIETSNQSWGNIRIGTEWRISNFRIRGGFGYFSNTYANGSNNNERYQASGGLGFRTKHFFTDLTYVWTQMKQDYYLYDPKMVNPANLTYHTNTLLTTIGFRF